MKTIIILILLQTGFALAGTQGPARNLASVRVEHARELMGPRYNKSVVARFEKHTDLKKNIYQIVDKKLPKAFKSRGYIIAKTIIQEAHKFALDPYFVMAVISGESSFNPLAKGPVGEIGLMQIRASTGKWMADILKTPWKGEKTLRDPVANIKLGVAYLAWLREKFNGHGQLYLAAYNMGPGSVKKALNKNIYPKDYPIHVMKRYIAFYRDMDNKNL